MLISKLDVSDIRSKIILHFYIHSKLGGHNL